MKERAPATPSTRTRFGYASAEIGINAVETTTRLFLLKYATDALLLPASLAGLLLGIGLIWDAVSDPLMGRIADRVAARRGSRRIFLPLGACVLALGTIAALTTPDSGALWLRAAWLLVGYLALVTGMTIIAVPHMTMASELGGDRAARAATFGARFVCINVGTLVAVALPALLLPDRTALWREAAPGWSLALAALVLASAGLAFRATRGLRFDIAAAEESRPLGRALLAPLRNPAFRPLYAAYLVAYLGITLNGALALYFYEYRLGLTQDAWNLVLFVFLIVFTVSIAVWVRISKSRGKLGPLRTAILGLGIGNCGYLFFPAGDVAWPLWFGAVGLGSCVGAVVLLDALLADVVDHERVRRGTAAAGVFFGVWRMGGKLVRAGALIASGLLLDAIGFLPNQPQSAATSTGLAWLFGPVVGATWIVAALVLFGYRFGDRQQARVRAILERRGERGVA